MKIGDLVWLDPDQFYEHDEQTGIVLDMLNTPDGLLIKVGWDNNEVGWYNQNELEIIYGGYK